MGLRRFLLLIFALVLTGCAPEEEPRAEEAPPIRFAYTRLNDRHHFLRICRGEQELFAFRSRSEILVMEKLFVRPYGHKTYTRTSAEFPDKVDYQPCLLDLKGDGDARYLIVVEWGGGNDAFNYRGWLVDTKDNFAIAGPVPAGECPDYKTPNPDLIFKFSEEVAYFGVRGYVSIGFPFKLKTGSMPELIPPPARPAALFDGDPARYLEDDDEVGICRLYSHLAEIGQLRQAPAVAEELGFPKEAIETYGPACLDALRACRYAPLLKRLNGDF